jgi:hopanoid biosynthesis associated protein HpnK
MKRVIVTADDFGRCLPINEAVEDAHRHGILTSASLMVTGDAAQDAVARARSMPDLAVGLHVTLVDGKPALDPEQIPDLVETDGRFSSRVVALGTKIYFDSKVQAQVAAEMRKQFELFRATGLAFDHVDSHHHYHLHPTVSALMIDLAVEFGVPAMRIPYEPPMASIAARRNKIIKRLVTGLFHRRATAKMRRAALTAGRQVNDRVFGFADSGAMDCDAVYDFLNALPDGLSEIYGHPATRVWDDYPMPTTYRCIDEYRALIDDRVRDRALQADIRLGGFLDHR